MCPQRTAIPSHDRQDLRLNFQKAIDSNKEIFAPIRRIRPRGGRLSCGYFDIGAWIVACEISRVRAVIAAHNLINAFFGRAGLGSDFDAAASLG